MGKFVEYEENEYGIIRLNRPEKHHAISTEMAKELQTILKEIQTRNIPFLVIESNGKGSFCAGGDLYEFHGELTEQEAHKKLSIVKEVLKMILLFPVPVIAFLHGNAFGGGCELATACDFRIAKENTKFGFVQSNLGILPSWGGGALLYEKIAKVNAFHWITEGEMYDAKRLLKKGWIQKIIPVEEWKDKKAILKNFLNKSYNQMYLLKQQYIYSLDIEQVLYNMEKEVRDCASIWETEIHQQHVKAFMNR